MAADLQRVAELEGVTINHLIRGYLAEGLSAARVLHGRQLQLTDPQAQARWEVRRQHLLRQLEDEEE